MKVTKKKETTKRSLRAKLVAREVYENARTNKPKTFKEIATKFGYSPASIKSNSIQKTKSYQEEIAPLIAQQQRILRKAYKALEDKDFAGEKALDIANISKIMVHDTSLMQGKSTENVASTPQVIVYSPNDPLARQLKGLVEPPNDPDLA